MAPAAVGEVEDAADSDLAVEGRHSLP